MVSPTPVPTRSSPPPHLPNSTPLSLSLENQQCKQKQTNKPEYIFKKENMQETQTQNKAKKKIHKIMNHIIQGKDH